ncbi:MAG: rRNA maturation RNase YbeY [Actinomycetota bacterium]
MTIDINNESTVAVEEALVLKLATFALDQLHVHRDADLSVIFADEATMESLHIQWMDEPGATDVLSFPMDELRPGKDGDITPAGLLGDIVICPQVAQKQAKNAGHDLTAEVLLLTTHGILHLLGFDHGTPEEEAEMFGLQKLILGAFFQVEGIEGAIPEPTISDAHRGSAE